MFPKRGVSSAVCNLTLCGWCEFYPCARVAEPARPPAEFDQSRAGRKRSEILEMPKYSPTLRFEEYDHRPKTPVIIVLNQNDKAYVPAGFAQQTRDFDSTRPPKDSRPDNKDPTPAWTVFHERNGGRSIGPLMVLWSGPGAVYDTPIIGLRHASWRASADIS